MSREYGYRLNKKLRELEPYEPVSGEYKIRLDANESFFNANEDLINSVKQRVSKIDFNRYPDPLCKNLCRLFAEYYGVDCDLVTAGNGSDELINIIVGAFLENDDKILTFAPDFSMYAFYGALLGHETIVIDKQEDMSFNVDKAIAAANERDVKMILFSNPCNPTSLGIPKSEVRRLIASVNALVVLDEAYMDFYGESLISEVGDFDNVILLKTASKAVGMAGIRLGFAAANPTITRALRAAKSPYNVNSVTQAIGEEIYKRPRLISQRTKAIIASKNSLYESLASLNSKKLEKIYKSDANFIFIKSEFAEEIYRALLEKSIAVRYFKAGYLRITAGTAEENASLICALGDILKG